MKKLFLIPVFLLSFFLCGCQSSNTEDYTSQLRLNINHINEKDEEKESGIVLEVFQKGYMLKDRILRPALVKVSE